MSWMNGNYFTKKEEAEARAFWESVGLQDNQIQAATVWHKSQMTAQLNLWVGLSVIFGIVIGLVIDSFL